MTGMERNADIVYMSSFAPLFARWNFTQWKPDMIWFNDNQVLAAELLCSEKCIKTTEATRLKIL